VRRDVTKPWQLHERLIHPGKSLVIHEELRDINLGYEGKPDESRGEETGGEEGERSGGRRDAQ
jgi:hypothetical protein